MYTVRGTQGAVKPALEFFDPDGIGWEALGGGMHQKVVAGDGASGDHTRLLRFDPGTVTSDTLTHEFWEEVWILTGSIRDLRLDETFGAGMYACRPPGMPHGPWESPDGCTTFEVRYSR